MSAVDDLHREIFGAVPPKAGTAYERFAAITLAVLGWRDVRHDVRERAAGRRASHQLDVTAEHPDGSVKRLIVECKDWNKTVGKNTVDALVGVQAQIRADAAAVISTRGFTGGAVDVAVDEDVALIVLRPYDEEPIDYARAVEVELRTINPVHSDWRFEVAESDVPAGMDQIMIATSTVLENADGSPAQTLIEVARAHASPLAEGRFECGAEFDPPLWFPTDSSPRIPVRALRWVETNYVDVQTIRIKARGEPKLVLHQLDEHGQPQSGRVVVDEDLIAWEIGPDGVVARSLVPARSG